MDEIRQQVRRVQRRMTAQRFLAGLPWFLFILLSVAVLAIGAAKIWPLGVGPMVWAAAWLGGSAVGGLLGAAGWAYYRRRGLLDAAIELDRCFGLKERVSSTLALRQEELDSEVGRALTADALRQVQRVDVGERFRVAANWKSLLPLLPAAAGLALLLLVDDPSRREAAASQTRAQVTKRIDKSAAELKKKIVAERLRAKSQGLKDAERIFRELEKGIDELTKSDRADRQRAMIKLNDLAKDLEQRRRELGSAEQLRRRLEQLKGGLDGPAEKIAESLRRGNLPEAMRELEKLSQKLQQGGLDKQEQQQLARQLDEMSRKLQEAADAQEQAKQDLQRRIQEKSEAGDVAEASRLQQQLDQLSEQTSQVSRLSQMAGKLEQSASSLRDGDPQEAAGVLNDLAAELEGVQNELDELESLDGAVTEIAQAKSSMNCEHCGGGG